MSKLVFILDWDWLVVTCQKSPVLLWNLTIYLLPLLLLHFSFLSLLHHFEYCCFFTFFDSSVHRCLPFGDKRFVMGDSFVTQAYFRQSEWTQGRILKQGHFSAITEALCQLLQGIMCIPLRILHQECPENINMNRFIKTIKLLQQIKSFYLD